MLDKLFKSFRGQSDEPGESGAELRKAVAALLVEAARADDVYTDDERALITQMIAKRFALSGDEALALRTEAEEAQAAANDVYGFSRVVKTGVDREGKISLIEDMWRIVLSDDTRDPHEEMIIRRLIGLIYLEDTDSAEARRRAEASAKA
ncbi:MAG: TerB family tellurite resistance protein [Pseudomonadota bacterium]